MSSMTTWNRLEAIPRHNDLSNSLRAEIADPLWLLARQRQFGELGGEDAGSPIESILNVEVASIDSFHPGKFAGTAVDKSVQLTPSTMPLEAIAEAQPVLGRTADIRLRIDAGQHYLRLLRIVGSTNVAALYREQFPFPMIDETAQPLVMAGIARRVPDGRAIIESLLVHRGEDASLSSLPAIPEVPIDSATNVLIAANKFLVWWENHHLGDEFTTNSWNSRRLEYEFSVGANLSDGPLVLRAEEYHGGHLDWGDFDVDDSTNLGIPATDGATRNIIRHTLPTRAFYAGMPAERFWEFEDTSVRFGVGSVGRTDLTHMLLNEFALTYGNDWYVVPLRLATGSVGKVKSLKVRDTFGIETLITQASSFGSSQWDMFHLTPHANSSEKAHDLFFLPPSLGLAPEGDSIEEVTWFRDEMANLVWAVEHKLEKSTGGWIPASEFYRRPEPVLSQSITGDIGDADLIYRLNSQVPAQWFPLVPVRPEGALPGVVELEMRTIKRIDVDGAIRETTPNTKILLTEEPLVIEEEEVPRDGIVTSTHWQITRSASGHYNLWLSNRKTSGAGQGSSGLVFDISRPSS